MKAYKLINLNGTVYGIFSCKGYATASASQHLMQRGSILKMEEITMPKFKVLHYDFMDCGGDETDYEATSKKELAKLVEIVSEGETSWIGGHTIAFGYDDNDNECFLIEEAA